MLNTGMFLWHAQKVHKNLNQRFVQGSEMWSQLVDSAGYNTYMTGKWHVKADAEAIFDKAVHVRPGMPKQTKQGYNRPIEGKPDVWSPYDKKFGGFWEGGKHWSEVLGDDAVGFIGEAAKSEKPLPNSLGLVDLASGEMTKFERVRSSAFGGTDIVWLAVHKMAPDGRDDEDWKGSDLLLRRAADGLPGIGPKEFIYMAVKNDAQVPNVCSDLAARNMGLPALEGSVWVPWGVSEVASGHMGSVYVTMDAGDSDPPPGNLSPESDDGGHYSAPASQEVFDMAWHFFQTGEAINTCNGPCVLY